ncbi:capsule biosynthesis protein [Phaeovulum sp. W22_SRMD_FR3]|uniref:capsule biosynthesis protein n=1 Tax=Phaeovulum sp. W22_SRMD_FR3 TaxID=3240274 RepID=UPI003F9E162F
MTTIPKAKKFRIRRHEPALAAATPVSVLDGGLPGQPAANQRLAPRAVSAPAEPERLQRQSPAQNDDLLAPHDDGFGEGLFPTAERSTVLAPNELTSDEEIAAIRAEGLTGRQLRMARRVAQRHGIDATSDFEAVKLLRRRGIDPFDRNQVLQIGQADDDDAPAQTGTAIARMDGKGADTRVQLPQTTRQGKNLPAKPAPMDEGSRAAEIIRMQRDIAKRRRRKQLLLASRLAIFVLLPTIMAGWYFYFIASPMYATRAEFVIQQADQTASGGLAGLFSGTQLATSQDSITVQSYLNSREALLRLDKDQGFKAKFSNPSLDAIQRLPEGASNEKAYKVYRNNVKIGYDPTEGIIKMEVIAPDPQDSVHFSQALINYAEEQVDQLTQRLREDQMQGARDSYADAEAKVLAAQEKVLHLQEQLGVLDPVTESNVVMSQVSTFETEAQKKRLQLQQLMDNAQPNAARVEGVKGDIARLEAVIAQLRSQLTQGSGTSTSLASVTGQLRIAEAELQTRQVLLGQAAAQLETARIEANKQVRYLSMGVSPVAPDEPTYPRKFENTILAFLIFGGIYLMMSLTASILREQVSS